MIFACPKCMGKLTECGGSAVCENGHSYDKSRYGYYNLLLSERGGVHGDNKEMVAARRAFLGRGYYGALADKISHICAEFIGQGEVILDAGCGEGYYVSKIAEKCRKVGTRIIVFDISKDAVRYAARTEAADEYAVASSYRMPIATGSVDMVVNTFSPQAKDETARVLRSGGYFIMAIPGEEHLFGLKSAIYDVPYKNEVMDTRLDGFTLVSEDEVRYSIELNTREDIASLFMMTPYAYRTRARDKEKILSLDSLKTDAHFIILVYRKD